jgi:hypothetical protein
MVMKKFLLALLMASMIATPALAKHDERKSRDERTEEIIAALIIGGLIGAAISDRREHEDIESYNERDEYIPRRNKYRDQYYKCRDHKEVSYRNGKRITYNVRRCN